MPDGTLPSNVISIRSNWAPDQIPARLFDRACEQALLGALLTKPRLIEVLPEEFSSSHYSDSVHTMMHDGIAAHASSGAAIFELLNYLASIDPELRDYASTCLVAMVGYDKAYVRGLCAVLTGLHQRRQLVLIADRLTVNAGDIARRDVQTGVMLAMAELEAVSASVPTGREALSLEVAMDRALAAHDRAASGEVCGITTGFKSLDEVLGGLDGGAVYIIGGRPGSGKSGLGLQMALHAAQAGHGVCFISLEMQAEQLARRAASYLAHVPQWKIKKGRCDHFDMDALMRSRKEIAGLPFTIEDQGGLNTQAIVLKAKAAQRRHGLKLLVVDHLHIVGTPTEATRMGATWAVEQVSKALKKIAKDFDIPVLALAQLSRGVEGRDDKHPNMSDLRQSGSIEEDAEAIMLLYRPEYYLGNTPPERRPGDLDSKHATNVAEWNRMRAEVAGKAEVIFAKVRDGETQTVEMFFDGARTCFEERAR